MIDDAKIVEARKAVKDFYREHGRHDLAWRQPEPGGSFDPYKILVSEIMLQQTQVGRATPKYIKFLEEFPTLSDLASSELGPVLRLWSGLGYNRRAKFLHQAAQKVMNEYGGVFPDSQEHLTELPGIGQNTAGAILAYAFNKPVVFVETNVRTVIIHHFFADHKDIPEKTIAECVKALVDGQKPREFYWALMDYGTYLKQTVGNLNKQSRSYNKQSVFKGSRREIRGQILRLLADRPLSARQLAQTLSDERTDSVIQDLLHEGLIRQAGHQLIL